MKSDPISALGVGIVLLLAVPARAVRPELPSKRTGPSAPKAAPVIKIDSALLQERLTLPNGVVQTRTYVNGQHVFSARKPVPKAFRSPRRKRLHASVPHR